MTAPTRPITRYHRRIMAWGGGLACLLFIVGAPIYLDRVESDLTDRVTAELDAAGYGGLAVSFSGQTGSIECTEPLGDPRRALDLAYDVRGVRAMNDLPDTCRVLTPPGDDDGGGDEPVDTEPVDTEPVDTTMVDDDTAADSDASATTTSRPADFGTVLSVLGGNPQFSLLDQLVRDAGLTESLAGDDPVTLFAPTNAAFDALSADAVARLRSSPELIAQVIGHHLVQGRLLRADLTTGPLTTAAGDELVVDADGDSPLIQGATIVEPDVLAANGVVHAIDALLLPDGVDLDTPDRLASMTATYSEGGYLLEGVVRSEVERTVLVGAATSAVGAAGVIDQLIVDTDLGLDEPTAQDIATLVRAVAESLVSGVVAFDGEMLSVTGTYANEPSRAALEEAAASIGADVTLSERPTATDADADTLEAELNTFVAANPILFEPNSSVLDESSLPILDEITRRASEVAGVTVTVEGHTDSDGDVQENLVLSQLRAVAVQVALVERGLDPDAVVAEGFGSERPIVLDGVEDKSASRRVEFRVDVA